MVLINSFPSGRASSSFFDSTIFISFSFNIRLCVVYMDNPLPVCDNVTKPLR